MKYREFLLLVGEMRAAQKEYFKNRTQTALLNSRRLEKLVDNAILDGKFYDDTTCNCIETAQPESKTQQQLLFEELG